MANNGNSNPKSALFIASKAEIRGITAYTYNLAVGLTRREMHIEVFCPGGERFDDFKKADISITNAEVIGRRIYDYFSVKRLADRAREAKVQLVHAQSPPMLGVAYKFASKLKLPLVVTVHDFMPEGERFPLSPRKIAGVAAVSEAVRTDLVTRGILPKDLIRVLPPGLDMERLCRYRPKVEERKTFTIGTIGRLEEIKGHQYLIEAAKILHERNVDIHVVISGDGPDLKKFRNQAADAGLEKQVTFVAPSADNTVVYSSLDVFVMPSLREALGHVMLEAMACGVPVVASGVGGVYGIISDGETGLLVQHGDSRELADALFRFVEEPELAKELGEAGRKSVLENFTLGRMAGAMLEFYSEILEAS
jgi:glycosyltransferase involved in cell wall biosynthesis